MLEQMLANRKIEKNQCNIKNAKTELKSAIGIYSGIEIWDWNQMLRLHNNLHLKWHTRSNMSVQRRNGQQTWILTWLCPKFYNRMLVQRHACHITRILQELKPVRTPVAIFGSLGVCIYVPASRHWLISYSPIHLT